MKVLDRIFNNIFDKENKYLCFYDKDGIISGGIWILFDDKADTVLKVLQNPEIGDILLAIDRDAQPIRTFEEMVHNCPNPKYIAGIAIPTQRKPRNIGKYIENYLLKMTKVLDKSKKKDYNSKVYKYLIDKMSYCKLMIQRGITMQEGGIQEC